MTKPKIVCVVGPTASGKTKMGILIARRFGGEVVSVDSMQIYRGMEIGTAAPTAEEMAGVPHHMVSIAQPGEEYSVARFTEEADRCIQDILARGKLPILVGGTGLYLDAIIRGHGFAGGEKTGEVRQKLQQQLESEGIEPLYHQLQQVDPAAAERLPLGDEKRILRALEVYLCTGKTITQHNEETARLPNRYDPIYIGLGFRDREEMKRLIDLRVDQMVQQGLLQEVEALLSSGVSRRSTAWQAIGFKEFLQYHDGNLTLQQAVDEVKLRSRQYAKRQLTWLRRNGAIHWILWENGRDFEKALQISTEILTAQGLS